MSTPTGGWEPVEVLAEPTRRRIYDAVRAAAGAVTRDDVAVAVGVSQRLAAFHLDRLADAGLLAVSYARPPGRTGPGAGRPAKRYAPAEVNVEVSVPPRRYAFVARVLAAAIAEDPTAADRAADRVARRVGEQVGAEHRPSRRPAAAAALAVTADVLADLGYEPTRADDALRLRNCPFHEVVDVSPQLVCGLNHQVVSGVLEGLGVDRHCVAATDGVAPDCCVTVRRAR